MEKPWKASETESEPDTLHIYEFGSFQLDPTERRLYRDGATVLLTPKVFDILVVLVENRGRLIGKERLMQSVWPDAIVEEGNLTANISILRKALGESQDERQFIETVPKQGYRFIAKVKKVRKSVPAVQHEDSANSHLYEISQTTPKSGKGSFPHPSQGKTWVSKRILWLAAGILLAGGSLGLAFYLKTRPPIPQPKTVIRSLAVLPFQLMGLTADDEFLGLGLADALITEFSQKKELIVRPTSVIYKYQSGPVDPRQVGRELGVEAILVGNVQHQKDRLRVTMQMLRSADGALLWSGKYDGQDDEIFALQDTLSRGLLTALSQQKNGQIEIQQQTGRPSEHYAPKNEAYVAYLRGRYHLYRYTFASYKKSLEFLTEATKLDPNYAQAFASLAEIHLVAAELYLPPNIVLPLARIAAEKALALDDSLAEAHTSLALVRAQLDWDWNGAEQAFLKAIEINPRLTTARDWYGWYLLWQGREAESIAEFLAAQDIEPLSLSVGTDVGTYYYCLRQYDRAKTELEKITELDTNYFPAHAMLGWVYLQQGRFPESIGAFEKALRLDDTPVAVAALAHVQARSGNRQSAETLLADLKQRERSEYVSPFVHVLLYLGLDDAEQTFNWLQKAHQEHSIYLIYLKVDPIFDPLRKDPRYADLMRELNLLN